MKKLIIVIFIISLLASVGCNPQPNVVEGYKDVSLDGFTVATSVDWQEAELPPEVTDAVADSEGTVIALSYRDKSATAELALIVMDVKGAFELEGGIWEGWDKLYEEQSFTKKEFAQMVSDSILFKLWISQNESMQEIRMFTIENRDACEILFTAEREDIPVNENFLFVFEEDKVGIVLIIVENAAWSTFQGCWPIIRDSARFE